MAITNWLAKLLFFNEEKKEYERFIEIQKDLLTEVYVLQLGNDGDFFKL
jgi:hypothetical protein